MGSWNASSHDQSPPPTNSDTSIALVTADIPFFAFLGKAKFEFYSNYTRVLGAMHGDSARRDLKEHAKADDRDVHLDYKQFPVAEKTFSLFNYNYNSNTGSASQASIVLTQSGASSLSCKDCYMYAGQKIP